MQDKKVVVTGAAGVLGNAVVDWFMARGAHVAVVDLNEEVISNTYPQRLPGNQYVPCDLTDSSSTHGAFQRIVSEFGSLDVICNIAGGFIMGEAVHETSDKTWDFLFELNARSILNTARAGVPVMLENGGGKIINVAARAGKEGAAMMGAYTASKSAVLRLTESMGAELREKNINVNCVMPSLIDTPRNRSDMPDADFTKWVAPEDIAKVIGFLASDDAGAIFGAAIPVDGLS